MPLLCVQVAGGISGPQVSEDTHKIHGPKAPGSQKSATHTKNAGDGPSSSHADPAAQEDERLIEFSVRTSRVYISDL